MQLVIKSGEASHEIVLPDTISGLVAEFGEEVIFSHAVTAIKTQARNKMFSLQHGKKPCTAEETMAEMTGWTPTKVSESGPRDGGSSSLIKKLGSASPEEKLAALKKLAESLGVVLD